MKLLFLLICAPTLFTACATKQFTGGKYDNVNEVRLLNDRWNEADQRKVANTMCKAVVEGDFLTEYAVKPRIMVGKITNATDEHLDKNLLIRTIRNCLLKSKRVVFVNNLIREQIDSEVDYQHSGRVNRIYAKEKGKQRASDLILTATISSNPQIYRDKKLVYYNVNMELTNLQSGEIVLAEEKEIRKAFRKK